MRLLQMEGNQQQGTGGYQFDPTNPGEIASALERLASLNPEDPEYAAILQALNAAAALGGIGAGDLLTAGLVEYNGEWMSPEAAQYNYAQDAQDLLVSGTPWSGLNADQQGAYANLYPQAAVQVGGARALNVMDPSLLTRELVQGYARLAGQWTEPQDRLTPQNHIYNLPEAPPTGNEPRKYMYLQPVDNHMGDPVYLGSVVPKVYFMGAEFSGDPAARFNGNYYWAFEPGTPGWPIPLQTVLYFSTIFWTLTN